MTSKDNTFQAGVSRKQESGIFIVFFIAKLTIGLWLRKDLVGNILVGSIYKKRLEAFLSMANSSRVCGGGRIQRMHLVNWSPRVYIFFLENIHVNILIPRRRAMEKRGNPEVHLTRENLSKNEVSVNKLMTLEVVAMHLMQGKVSSQPNKLPNTEFFKKFS